VSEGADAVDVDTVGASVSVTMGLVWCWGAISMSLRRLAKVAISSAVSGCTQVFLDGENG
jgi:hypothetical protein